MQELEKNSAFVFKNVLPKYKLINNLLINQITFVFIIEDSTYNESSIHICKTNSIHDLWHLWVKMIEILYRLFCNYIE